VFDKIGPGKVVKNCVSDRGEIAVELSKVETSIEVNMSSNGSGPLCFTESCWSNDDEAFRSVDYLIRIGITLGQQTYNKVNKNNNIP